MVPKNTAASIEQTASGTDHIQVAGSNNVVNRITNFFIGDSKAQRDLQNRRAMLKLVKNTWINGVLDHSLYNEVLLQLGMEELPDAVGHPWDMQIRMPDRPNRTLPAGISMLEVFHEMNGAMLILGEPGSGKTTMMLQLARECIDQAEQNHDIPIPVVFNLSSWDGRQMIETWLVDELQTKYNVDRKTAKGWVENDDLLLLLDGVDEVKQESRDECVKAINDFRQNHGLTTQIVVCSRIADYEALTTKLSLTGAVLLQPLTSEQIEVYFEQAGPGLEEVHNALKIDEILQEMVKQPLLLSVLTLTYRDKPPEAFSIDMSDNVLKRRAQLFDTYIQAMLERTVRTKSELYSSQQTEQWLSWLAKKMIEHNQVPLFIERIQPSWLDEKKGIRDYKLLVVLMFVTAFGLIFGLLANDLLFGAFFGLIVGVLLGQDTEIHTVDTLKWTPKEAIRGFISGLIAILFFGLGGVLNGVPPDALPNWLPSWLFALLFSGLVMVVVGGLFGGLYGGLSGGLHSKRVEFISYPGERITLSAKNLLFVSLTAGLIFGLNFALITGLIAGLVAWQGGGLPSELPSELIAMLMIGLIFGLVFGLRFGGIVLVQHYALRFLISKANLLPWNLIPFLDYCVDLIFLRRVGGGYIFFHRLLLEHFAARYRESQE